ncbi:hypothetical protein B0O99DRAFT_624345 [Bisporella sp. PMI_857]|nr:hypothetical protein B0O99DRAFT_624345 [Bisporella sp. PMI_857]
MFTGIILPIEPGSAKQRIAKSQQCSSLAGKCTLPFVPAPTEVFYAFGEQATAVEFLTGGWSYASVVLVHKGSGCNLI